MLTQTLFLILFGFLVLLAIIFGFIFVSKDDHSLKNSYKALAKSIGLTDFHGNSAGFEGKYHGHILKLDLYPLGCLEGGVASICTRILVILNTEEFGGFQLKINSQERRTPNNLNKINNPYSIKNCPEKLAKKIKALTILKRDFQGASSLDISIKENELCIYLEGIEKDIKRLHSLIDLLSNLAYVIESI